MIENILYEFRPNLLDYIADGAGIVIGLGWIYVVFFDSSQNLGGMKLFLRIFTIVIAPFLVIISSMALYADTKEAYKYKELLDSGKVYEVEGFVENYHCPPASGHDREHFDINGVHFEYSYYTIKNAYHKPASNGGVIKRDGQHLKIKYIEKTYDEDDEDIIRYPGDGIEGDFPEGENVILYVAEIKDQ